MTTQAVIKLVEGVRVLKQKVAAQAAVIEKLRAALDAGPSGLHTFTDNSKCACSQCAFVRLRAEALSIPTESTQILQEWLDSVLGEPYLELCLGTPLYRKPEILK